MTTITTTVGQPEPCPFCRIVRGETQATIVQRWTDAIAFVPLNPVVDGHVLVVPHLHVVDFADDPYTAAITMRRAATLARPPANIITSAGPEATQTIRHLHLHIVPRAFGDGLALPWTVPA